MRMVDVIDKKKKGKELTTKEIEYVIQGYTKGDIPDYQMSALTMAIYFKGMTDKEVSDLTMAMVESGDVIDLSPIEGIKVDKHSTGGVGDKTSFIVGPLVASVGVPVAKMSGRGLGHTGGTLDKLESIKGFQVELTREEFIDNVNKNRLAIIGQTGNLTPADKKLYGLRDVTSTVDSIPLIASSIMSKKIASGADAIVLDVKTGSGAFMKSLDQSKELAKAMVGIGKQLNRKTVAIISDMNQPLGFEIGNANELKEAISVLKGEKIADLREVSLTVASHMTVLANTFPTFEDAYAKLEEVLDSGKALDTLKKFIKAQGGNPKVVDNPGLLPQALYHFELKADKNGYISNIEAESVGSVAMMLGAGRKTKEDKIDHAVGITLKKKVGSKVRSGDTLAILHSNYENVIECTEVLRKAYSFADVEVKEKPMIYDVIHSS